MIMELGQRKQNGAGLAVILIIAFAPAYSYSAPSTQPETVALVPNAAPATAPAIMPGPLPIAALAPQIVSVVLPEAEPSPVQDAFPAPRLLPEQTVLLHPESKPSTVALVAGTTAAVMLAPIAAPLSILFGFAVAALTPTASQLGEYKVISTKKSANKGP